MAPHGVGKNVNGNEVAQDTTSTLSSAVNSEKITVALRFRGNDVSRYCGFEIPSNLVLRTVCVLLADMGLY